MSLSRRQWRRAVGESTTYLSVSRFAQGNLRSRVDERSSKVFQRDKASLSLWILPPLFPSRTLGCPPCRRTCFLSPGDEVTPFVRRRTAPYAQLSGFVESEVVDRAYLCDARLRGWERARGGRGGFWLQGCLSGGDRSVKRAQCRTFYCGTTLPVARHPKEPRGRTSYA